MKVHGTFILFLLLWVPAFAQDTKSKPYWRTASEFIFSMGAVDMDSASIDPILRFSGFFHFQEQLHIDFNRALGIYTGVGVRNVGMINELNDSIKIKQRVYSLAVPLALKIGSLPNGFNAAIGGEAEFFFHYKQKVFYDDDKFRKSEWVSDKVNLFNPSVFLELHTRYGSYLRFKYYLLDFLVEDEQEIKVYGRPVEFKPSSSQLFYLSIGTTIKQPVPGKNRKKSTPVDTALW